MEQILLCGNTNNYARGICQILLDPHKHTLSHLKQLIFIKDPRQLIFDHHNHVFIASFGDNKGCLSSYYVNDDYDMIDSIFEENTAPISLAIDHDNQLLFSLHHNGHLFIYSIQNDGSLYKEDDYIFNHQTSHLVVTPDHHLLVSDSQTPTLSLLTYTYHGKVDTNQTFHFEGIEGYTQLMFHPNHTYFYAISQKTHRLHIFDYNKKHIEEVSTLNTLPQHQKGQCIQMVYNKKQNSIYCLNRGSNTISVFQVDHDGELVRYIHSLSTEGMAPHAMNLNADQNFLMITNELSHNLTLFHITENNDLQLVSSQTEIPDVRQIISSEL